MTEILPALIVAAEYPASLQTPGGWLTVGTDDSSRCEGLGIELKRDDDYVVIKLADGSKLHVYGDGQIWYKGGNHLNISEDALPWK